MKKKFNVSRCCLGKWTAHKNTGDYRVFDEKEIAQFYADCRNEGLSDEQALVELASGCDPIEEQRLYRP